MSTATAPYITGPVFRYVIEAGTALKWARTGSESFVFDAFQLARLEGWGVKVQTDEPAHVAESGADRAARFASMRPYVESIPIAPPELTGNLVADVRTLTGLTNQQLADFFEVSERRISGWRQRDDIPAQKRRVLEALRAIGLTLGGGLGPQGVALWLTSGSPTPLSALRRGDIRSVVNRVRGFEDSTSS